MASEELKPCPFCGMHPTSYNRSDERDEYAGWECSNDDCGIVRVYVDYDNSDIEAWRTGEAFKEAQKEATRRWNTRNLALVDAEVERLESDKAILLKGFGEVVAQLAEAKEAFEGIITLSEAASNPEIAAIARDTLKRLEENDG